MTKPKLEKHNPRLATATELEKITGIPSREIRRKIKIRRYKNFSNTSTTYFDKEAAIKWLSENMSNYKKQERHYVR